MIPVSRAPFVAVALVAFLPSLAVSPPPGLDGSDTITSVVYGLADVESPPAPQGFRLAFVNATWNRTQEVRPGGRFESFVQVFTDFRVPTATGAGALDGPQVRFSYYADHRCVDLNPVECPLGGNTTTIVSDVLTLTMPRVVAFNDTDGNGRLSLGDAIKETWNLAAPGNPRRAMEAFGALYNPLNLPYPVNYTTPDGWTVRQGSLSAGDPDLDYVYGFRFLLGTATPVNTTITALLLLRGAEVAGTPLSPNLLKVNLSLLDIPVVPATGIAIALNLSSDHATFGFNGTAAASEVSGAVGPAISFFNWSRAAYVDGSPVEVGESVAIDAAGTAATIVLSYPMGRAIAHEPLLGFLPPEARPASGLGDQPGRDVAAVTFVALGATAATAVATAIIVVLDRRK